MNFSPAHPIWVFPATRYPVYSGIHILNFLIRCRSWVRSKNGDSHCPLNPIVIGFSAGVVGAVQATWAWRQLGGQIAALLAVDGWGVPLIPDLPCYRLSHDHFTHWSSGILGQGADSFYAVPSVPHANLWQHPQHIQGWHIGPGEATASTAAVFIHQIVHRHCCAESISIKE